MNDKLAEAIRTAILFYDGPLDVYLPVHGSAVEARMPSIVALAEHIAMFLAESAGHERRRMPEVKTWIGQQRHLERAVIVVVHRGIIRPLMPLMIRLNDSPTVARINEIVPTWLRLPSLETIGIVYVIVAIPVALALLLGWVK